MGIVIIWLIYGQYMVIIWLMMVNNSLVGGWATPLKNMSSSVGMMTFPTEWQHKIHVPVTTNQ